MNKNLVAIYGGSFNPPTIAHEMIARDILSTKEVKKVVYLPVGDDYKKQNLISADFRYDMLKILVDSLDNNGINVELNDLEINAYRRLYTIESLRLLKNQYNSNLAFVMGTDNIKEFKNWYEPKKLLEEFYFIVIERENDNVEQLIMKDKLLNDYKNKFIIIKETSYKNVSSTYIRNNLYTDSGIRNYINSEILDYIKSNELYKGGELS